MSYEMTGGWKPAPAVLERGSESCSEYTFAFLSLCRIAGLPSNILLWEYNSQHQVTAKGQASILVEKYGEWSPYSPQPR